MLFGLLVAVGVFGFILFDLLFDCLLGIIWCLVGCVIRLFAVWVVPWN